MTLPPETLKIKRKRDDDAPPEILQLEHYNDGRESKRRTTTSSPEAEAWVFQKVPEDTIKKKEAKTSLSSQHPWESKVPVVKATQPGDELRGHAPASKGIPRVKSVLDYNAAASSIMPASSAASGSMFAGHGISNPPRRFHLTRSTKAIPRTSAKNGVHKARGIATFKERHPKFVQAIKKDYEEKQAGESREVQMQLEDLTNRDVVEHIEADVSPAIPEPGKPRDVQVRFEDSANQDVVEHIETDVSIPEAGKPGEVQMQLEDSANQDVVEHIEADISPAIPSRALKKPGRNARRSLNQTPPLQTKIANHDVGSEQLAAELRKFTLETMAGDQAGRNDEFIPMDPTTGVLRKKSEVKFKPKPPAQRYSERHEDTRLPSMPSQLTDSDRGEDTDAEDENDYVTDTYIRVPAHTLQIVPMDMGILVIENEEEMQEFYEYGEDSDDDSDIFDDEIDENAESNPNNEYPEEEVDSDDELDLNAYHYRNNASDDEEFDFDEANYSDDGNDLPWTETAWGNRKKPAWEVDDVQMT